MSSSSAEHRRLALERQGSISQLLLAGGYPVLLRRQFNKSANLGTKSSSASDERRPRGICRRRSRPLTLFQIVIAMIFDLLLIAPPSFTHNILCYECKNAHSNTLCNSETLITNCEENFDTCQTIIHYSDVSEKITITKSCTMNTSCWDQKQVAEEHYPCESSQKTSWTCVSCCAFDKCNRDAATESSSASHVLVGFVTLVQSLLFAT